MRYNLFYMFLLCYGQLVLPSLKDDIVNYYQDRDNIYVLVQSLTKIVRDERFDRGAQLLAATINARDENAAKEFTILADLPYHNAVENALCRISFEELAVLTRVNPYFNALERAKQGKRPYPYRRD